MAIHWVESVPFVKITRCGDWSRLAAKVILWLCSVFVGLIHATVSADDVATTPLWKLVPADAALIYEFRQPEDQRVAWMESPLAERFHGSPLWKRLRETPFWQYGQSVDQHVKRQTGTRLSQQLWDSVSSGVLLAVEFPANRKPEGIILGIGKSPGSPQRLFETLDRVDPKGKSRSRDYQGQTYLERRPVAASKEPSVYLVVLGSMWAISDQERLIHRAIEQFQQPPSEEELQRRHPQIWPLRQTLLGKSPADQSTDQPAVALFVDARRLEPWLHQQPTKDEQFLKQWKRIRALEAHLSLKDGPLIEGRIELDPATLSPAWLEFCRLNSQPVALPKSIPHDAVAVVAGTTNFSPFAEWFFQLASHEKPDDLHRARRVLTGMFAGRDVVKEVLPNAFQTWSAIGILPPLKPESRPPVHGVVALNLAETPASANTTEPRRSLTDCTRSAAEFGLQFWAGDWNARHLDDPLVTMKSRSASSTKAEEFRWLENYPHGEPTVAIDRSALRLATARRWLELSDSETGQTENARWERVRIAEWTRVVAVIDVAKVHRWWGDNLSELERRGWARLVTDVGRELPQLIDLADVQTGWTETSLHFSLRVQTPSTR